MAVETAPTSEPGRLSDVGLDIAWNRLISICDEGATALRRASVSVIIGDVCDFAVALTDARGETLAASPQGVSLFNGSVSITSKEVLRRFPIERMQERDTFICNDPWMTSGHLPDVFLCSPVMYGGCAVGLVSTIGHITDIGGSLKKLGTTEIYEEGLRFPPMRFLTDGEENADFVEFVRFNTRAADAVLNDLYAELGAHQVVQRGVAELLQDMGHENLETVGAAILDRNEHAMRDAILALPTGEFFAEETSDGLIEPAHIKVTVIVLGDGTLTVDFTGSADEEHDGSNNSPYSCTYSETAAMVHTILAPELPINSGCFRPIRVVAPAGSMFNAQFPRAVNARTKAVFRADPVILRAFAHLAPERVMASPGLPGHYQINAHRDGQTDVSYMMLSGGMGGSAHGPGESCLWSGTMAGTSVEVLEQSSPVVISRRRIFRGSGGTGAGPGGCGEELSLKLHPFFEGRASMSTHPSMLEYPGGGILGGEPGLVGEMHRNGHRFSRTELNAAGGHVRLEQGDEVLIRTPGGAGYGRMQDAEAAEGADAARGAGGCVE